MHSLWLMTFSIAAGFTASAIMANLYRLCGFAAVSTGERVFQAVVLIVAGPSVVLESAIRGLRKKQWRPLTFWLTTAGVLYWSLALGLLVIEISIGAAKTF